MGRSGSPKRLRHTALLPDELMHVIFGKLEFKDKLNAGLVCKQWDQLLKAGTAHARHWRVDYNLDTIWSSSALETRNRGPPAEQLDTIIERWFVKRAAAIKSVHVTATLSSDRGGIAKSILVKTHLPCLVGSLSKYTHTLHLTFRGNSPSLLSSSAFLNLLCPMVTTLSLTDLLEPVTPGKFAAICTLTNLEALSISAARWKMGLEELTSDISKLVNLKLLTFGSNGRITHIPESISCLQKLENLVVEQITLENLPVSLGTLSSLVSLSILRNHRGLCLPHPLQGLKNLAAVKLEHCQLEMIPEQLTGLAALTSLDVSGNMFILAKGALWWPPTLSRLTQLKTLVIAHCLIDSIPPEIAAFRQLTKLDAGFNRLETLPDELGSLANLKELVLASNDFHLPPISVLSLLTALTAINLRGGQRPVFKIRSTLLPIFHPGLVSLDLRQVDRYSEWDPTSLYHLGRALAELADRRPVPTLLFKGRLIID